jgi:hypothetical protein
VEVLSTIYGGSPPEDYQTSRVEITSLLLSSQVPNVSKSDDIQSIKQYVDQQQDQMKQHIGGLEKPLMELTRAFEKSVAPSFLSYLIHQQQMGIRSPSHFMVCR